MASNQDNKLPEVLSRLLDSLGLDENTRKRRMSCQTLKQLLLSSKLKSARDGRSALLHGGTYETTTVESLVSDTNILDIINDVVIIDNIHQWRPRLNVPMYMIDSAKCSDKAFVRLILMSNEHPVPDFHCEDQSIPDGHHVDETGQILLKSESSSLPDVVTYKFVQDFFPALIQPQDDTVVALKCCSFPQQAIQWKERQTEVYRSRIDSSIVDQSLYCFLVGSGKAGSPTEDIEWRLSFSHIENQLVYSWNNVQYKCYVMMKFINQDLIRPFVPNTLCSYHFKTILMWMNEEYHSELFVESHLDKCLLACLKNLISCVKRRYLPHYFVEGSNLFHTNANDKLERVSSVLEKIASDWPTCLFNIKSRSLGAMLNACMVRKVPVDVFCNGNPREIKDGPTVNRDQEISLMLGEAKLEFRDKDPVEKLKLILDLHTRVKSTNWHDDQETIDQITLFMKDFLCSIGLNLIRRNVTSNKTAYHYRRAGVGLIFRLLFQSGNEMETVK